MGEEARVDVTLNYIVKDFDGKVYISESETILVEDQKSFKKKFQTGNLPVGNYIVGLELVYPSGVATSSAHFEVVDKTPLNLRLVLIMLGIGILVLIVFIVFIMVRYKKKRKRLLSRRR